MDYSKSTTHALQVVFVLALASLTFFPFPFDIDRIHSLVFWLRQAWLCPAVASSAF